MKTLKNSAEQRIAAGRMGTELTTLHALRHTLGAKDLGPAIEGKAGPADKFMLTREHNTGRVVIDPLLDATDVDPKEGIFCHPRVEAGVIADKK